MNPNGYPGAPGHHFVPAGFHGFPSPFPPPMVDHSVVAAAASWVEYKAQDGRPYYFNPLTQQTSWEKPEELRPEAERWVEYKTDDGRVYYYNTLTKATTWTIPPELEKQKKASKSFNTTPEQAVSSTPPAMKPKVQYQPEPEKSDDESSNSNLPSEAPISEPSTTPPTKNSKSEPAKSDFEEFKEILLDKKIASNVSWEICLKYVTPDPRFARFRTHPERKAFFNLYKTTRIKEEKEDQRNKVKKAMESLEKFLRTSDRMNSAVRYRHACDMFRDMNSWMLVPDLERREIFDEALKEIIKKEREEAKELRKRNMSALSDILDSMAQITHRTSWSEAQQLLIDNPTFSGDPKLLSIDKEDALTVFENHIRQMETEEEAEKANEKKIRAREQRRNREAFLKLLDELHASGKLNSLSKWSTLYHDISADSRFEAMLSQPLNGSSPLDLFKFYVEDLKARYEDEKQLIKDILKQANFVMGPNTEFSEFVELLSQDPRSGKLDSGNVKLMHEKLLEREKEREKEKLREENRAKKKLEAVFMSMLEKMNPPLSEDSTWEEVRRVISGEEAFYAIQSEEERIVLFQDALRQLVETCSHHHNHKHGYHKYGNVPTDRKSHSSKRGPSSSKQKPSRPSSRRSRSSSMLSNHSSISDASLDSRHSRSSSAMSRSSSSSSSVPSIINDGSSDDEERVNFSMHRSDHRGREPTYSSSRHGHSSTSSYHHKSTSSRSSRQSSPPRSGHRRSRDHSLTPRERESKKQKVSTDNNSASSLSKKERTPRPEVPLTNEPDITELEKQRKLLLLQLADSMK